MARGDGSILRKEKNESSFTDQSQQRGEKKVWLPRIRNWKMFGCKNRMADHNEKPLGKGERKEEGKREKRNSR